MLKITNYNSGELEISDQAGRCIRLNQDQSNRLILAARMHNVEPFIQKLPQLVPDIHLATEIKSLLINVDGSDRWNLKEKFARLHTVVAGHPIENPESIQETVEIH